ncbi:MAG: AAA family ATPase [Candidatus Lokiarchaeota archaeon]|nr:AAA family ATPase [Candidatus Harpocratesius repetitus]
MTYNSLKKESITQNIANRSFPPIIAVTGGKGGTGKTLVATNLAVAFTQSNSRVLLVDCDVENPNTFILLGKSLENKLVSSQPIDIFIPKFNKEKCVKCGICQKGCYRHAILQFPEHYPSLMEHLCSGCQVCQRICPHDAIEAGARQIGTKYFIPNAFENLDLLVGELTPSEALSAFIVENLISQATTPEIMNQYDIIIIDSAPGAHCDVEKILNASDMVISVTEPTPFGEHDLNRILELLRLINKPSYFILNRSNLTNESDFLTKKLSSDITKYLGNIEVDKTIMEDYAKGKPFVQDSRTFPAKNQFLEIFHKIQAIIKPIHDNMPSNLRIKKAD